jgi:hypothetical protein
VSRLRHLHIPFAQGADESVDSKVLPDGVFASLVNGRLHRAGDLRLRRGWRPVDDGVAGDDGVTIGADYVVTDLYSSDQALVALALVSGAGLQLQSLLNQTAATPWVRRRGVELTPVTSVRAIGNQPNREADVYRASSAVTSDGVWGAVLLQTTTKTTLRVFRMATDETLFYDDFSGAGDANVRKIVSLGTTFGIVRYTGSAIQLQPFNPAAGANWLGSQTTLVSSAAVTQFDVATAPETTPGAVHLVYVHTAGEVSYAQFSTAGVQVGSTKQVSASGAQVAYIASDDVTAHVVFQSSATTQISLLSFAATGSYTTSAGPTALDAGQVVDVARFAIGLTTEGTDAIWVAASISGEARIYQCTTAHVITEVEHNSTELVSGWVTGRRSAAIGVARGRVEARADAALIALDQPWFIPWYGLSKRPRDVFEDSLGAAAFTVAHQPYSSGRSPSGDVLAIFNRISDASVTTNFGSGAQFTLQTGVRAFKLFDSTSSRPGVTFSGALYVTGGMLTQFVGGGPSENGFLAPVVSVTSSSNSTGSIGAGSYTYRAVVVWTDEDGRLHRSPVSAPNDEEVVAPDDTVSVTVHVAKTLRRDPNLVTNPVVELYRTEAGPGELFYLVASATVSATASDIVVLTDLLADSAIIDNKRLYTEGEFGSVSGSLDVTPPSPSRYAGAVQDRLVLGSADAEYQFSQLVLPEEPVAFTQPGVSGPGALVYQDTVEGAITGLGTLDNDVVLGTRRTLFVTSAAGGPNLAGVGEFPSPSRLPTDVGVYNADSIVEDAAGLWFLGDVDKLYLLPRGQGTPVWAGQPVRLQLGTTTVIGAGRETVDDLTMWGLASAEALWRTGANGVWGRDTLPFTPKRLISHLGRLYAVATDGTVWAQEATAYGDGTSGATAVVLQYETGDINVFGLAGQGRLAVVEHLGEFQSACTLATEISYDSGATWATAVTHTISGLSAGAQFQRSVDFARQRGGKFRLRVTMTPSSSTGEGCRLTGLALYYALAGGATRLDSAKRK